MAKAAAKASKPKAKAAAKPKAKAAAKPKAKASATATTRPTARAKSIRRGDLEKLTAAAVRATTTRPTRIIKEPIWGFVLDTEVGAVETANVVARRLVAGAGENGINLKVEPSVLLRKGITIAGFIERDLSLPVRF